MLRRRGLSVSPRFLWECLTSRTVSPFPAPATSHAACGFPALRAPAHLLFFTLNREDFSFVIHLDRQPRTSRRREAQTGSRARSGSRSERTLDAVEHSRTLMEWWPFLIFHRGGLRIKVINNNTSREGLCDLSSRGVFRRSYEISNSVIEQSDSRVHPSPTPSLPAETLAQRSAKTSRPSP